MQFTGERLVPAIPQLENMIVEELARLNFGRAYFQGKKALDFGCGAGYAAHFMRTQGANFAVGFDLAPDAIQFAHTYYGQPGLSYTQMNCLETAFAAHSFDFICSLDVIEHFTAPDIERFLTEIRRLLKPDGVCLITTPNKKHSSPDGEPTWQFHLKEFFYPEFQTLLQQHFQQVDIYGSRVPIYEDRAIRTVTNSPLSKVKHYLPPKLRVGFSSGLRYLMKKNLTLNDVTITPHQVDTARVFVALCRQPH